MAVPVASREAGDTEGGPARFGGARVRALDSSTDLDDAGSGEALGVRTILAKAVQGIAWLLARVRGDGKKSSNM